MFVTCCTISDMPKVLVASISFLRNFLFAASMIRLLSSSRALVAASRSFFFFATIAAASSSTVLPPYSHFCLELLISSRRPLIPVACLYKIDVMSLRVSGLSAIVDIWSLGTRCKRHSGD